MSSLASRAQAQREELTAHLNGVYASMLSDGITRCWFDGSGFANFGYWLPSTATARDAGHALIDRLAGMVPADARRDRVLDVACNAGGTTERLARHFGARHLTGIDIGAAQLALATGRVPEATFRRMDAAALEFGDNSFDVVVCVEAAHHFHTRAGFLRQAYRVLKPGGCLVLADVLFTLGVSLARDLRYALLKRLQPDARAYARENIVANLDAYRELFGLAGFELLAVEDALDRTWKAYRQRHRAFLIREWMKRPALARTILARLELLALWDCTIYAYPLVAARKPG